MSEHQKAALFWPGCTAEALVSVMLCSQFVIEEFFRHILGTFSEVKPKNKTQLEVWFSFNAKEAFVFAQVSANFPSSQCLSMFAAAFKNNRKPQSLKPKLAAVEFLAI